MLDFLHKRCYTCLRLAKIERSKMEKFITMVLSAIVLALIAFAVVRYMNLPTVEVSVGSRGECLRAYGPNGPISCHEAMSGSYEKIWVQE